MARTPIETRSPNGRVRAPAPAPADARGARLSHPAPHGKPRARQPRISWRRLMKLGYGVAAVGLMALVIVFVIGILLFSGEAKDAPMKTQQTAIRAQLPPPGATATPVPSKVPAQPLTVEQVQQLIASGDAIVIDARPTADYIAGHIPGVQSMPHYHLQGQAENLPRNKQIVTICNQQLCPKGPEAAGLISKVGHDNTAYLEGGIEAWVAAGLPVEKSQQ